MNQDRRKKLEAQVAKAKERLELYERSRYYGKTGNYWRVRDQARSVDYRWVDDMTGDDLRFLRAWWDDYDRQYWEWSERRWGPSPLHQRHHVTQAYFAGQLGIATNTYARMEQGKQPITIPMARLIVLTVATNTQQGTLEGDGFDVDCTNWPISIAELVKEHRTPPASDEDEDGQKETNHERPIIPPLPHARREALHPRRRLPLGAGVRRQQGGREAQADSSIVSWHRRPGGKLETQAP